MNHTTDTPEQRFVGRVNALLGGLCAGATAQATRIVLDRVAVHHAAVTLENDPRWTGVRHEQAVAVVEDIIDTYLAGTRREGRR